MDFLLQRHLDPDVSTLVREYVNPPPQSRVVAPFPSTYACIEPEDVWYDRVKAHFGQYMVDPTKKGVLRSWCEYYNYLHYMITGRAQIAFSRERKQRPLQPGDLRIRQQPVWDYKTGWTRFDMITETSDLKIPEDHAGGMYYFQVPAHFSVIAQFPLRYWDVSAMFNDRVVRAYDRFALRLNELRLNIGEPLIFKGTPFIVFTVQNVNYAVILINTSINHELMWIHLEVLDGYDVVYDYINRYHWVHETHIMWCNE